MCKRIKLNLPSTIGKDVNLKIYVDSDHAGDMQNRRSRYGFFVYINSALMMWLLKKQATIRNIHAELVSMKSGIETLWSLLYKRRTMGVAI